MSSDRLSAKDKTCARIIESGLLGLIILTPLPAGSVYEWSVLVIQLVVAVMFGAYVLMTAKPPLDDGLAPIIRRARTVSLAFWLFIVLQWLPLPVPLIKTLSPGAWDYRRLYAPGFSGTRSMSFSLVPSLTLQRGLELLSCFLLGFLVLKTVTKRRQILRLWAGLIAVGVFEAVYGLYELYNRHPRILISEKVHNLDSVTGTFVNRNHFSGYLEMIIPLAVGLLIARSHVFSRSAATWRERVLRLQEGGFAQNLMIFLAIIVMATAIVFSQSRSGLFILILTFVLFSGLVTIYFEISPFQKKWIKNGLRAVFLIILLICFYFGFTATLERFSRDSLLHEKRPLFWAHSLRLFSLYPLTGTGLGTFGELAPNVENASGPVAIVHAHNDYLEFLSELGSVGALLLLGGIFLALIVSFLNWRKRSRLEIKGLALGGIVSLICILTHSLTDFNLHIPANMVLFSVVLPLTLVTTFHKPGAIPRER
jgi:O-antigen ligase